MSLRSLRWLHRGRMALLGAVLLLAGGALTMATNHDFSTAREVLVSGIHDRTFPGAAVMVGTGEEVLWSAAFGHFDYSEERQVTPETIYDLASVTKVASTTAVLMRLVAMGKIDLQQPVVTFMPEFAAGFEGDEARWRQEVTVAHLLYHTGGLASWRPFHREVEGYSALLKALIATPMEAAPGDRYRYSDLGFILLGEIAGRAGGKPLSELEQELLWQPLGMKETWRNPPAELIERIAPTERWPDREDFVHGVVHDENARAGEGITGHAGLFSTTEDLARLAQELLRGAVRGSELFPRETVELFTTREREDLNRGLGWALSSGSDSDGTVLSRRAFGHTGFTGTSIWIDPERDLFIILLSNRVHPTRDNPRIGRVRSQLTDAVVRAVER